MNIVEATAAYEHWLAQHITIVAEDLDHKHDKMVEEGAFGFFRATYYRWLQQAPDLAPELDGPVVASVGDLHLENFGTWQTREEQLAWGVNDFDESECLPYTLDLARLATSASLAIAASHVPVDPTSAHQAILHGYTTSLTEGGEPFVLDGQHHERLADLVHHAATPPATFWTDLTTDPIDHIPPAATAAFQLVQPTPNWEYRSYRRFAGLGSRGHRRYVAIGPPKNGEAHAGKDNNDNTDDLECRESKELSPPAGRWLGRPPTARALDKPAIVRAPDPWQRRHHHWSARRLAPDCTKLELAQVDVADRNTTLFEWMGRETANIHLGTPEQRATILHNLEQRPPDWLSHTAHTLADAVTHDWQHWSDHHNHRHHDKHHHE